MRRLLVLLLVAGVLLGGYAWSVQLREGLVVTGMRTVGLGGAPWGVYIALDIYFVGICFAGVALASIVRLFGVEPVVPFTRIAIVLSLLAVGLGAGTIFADLGRPERGFLELSRYARPSSPFFGNFTLVATGYFFASLVHLYLSGRPDAARCAATARRGRWLFRIWASGWRGTAAEAERRRESGFWLALATVPLLVAASSTLGFVFGIQSGRPGWYGALQAPAFVVLAAATGTGLLLAVSAISRRVLGLERELPAAGFAWLGNLLAVLLSVYLYFMAVEELTAHYASTAMEDAVAHEIVAGRWSPLFASVVGAFAGALAILAVQFLVQRRTGRRSIAWTAVAGLLVNGGAIVRRFLIVVPSQVDGMLLSYPRGTYVPTWVEVAVIGGLFSAGALGFLVFARVFPLVPSPEAPPSGTGADGGLRAGLRAALAGGAFGSGVVLAVAGFAASARAGTEPWLDPVLPAAPVVFMAGVMAVFYSFAVYETLPPAPRR